MENESEYAKKWFASFDRNAKQAKIRMSKLGFGTWMLDENQTLQLFRNSVIQPWIDGISIHKYAMLTSKHSRSLSLANQSERDKRNFELYFLEVVKKIVPAENIKCDLCGDKMMNQVNSSIMNCVNCGNSLDYLSNKVLNQQPETDVNDTLEKFSKLVSDTPLGFMEKMEAISPCKSCHCVGGHSIDCTIFPYEQTSETDVNDTESLENLISPYIDMFGANGGVDHDLWKERTLKVIYFCNKKSDSDLIGKLKEAEEKLLESLIEETKGMHGEYIREYLINQLDISKNGI